MSPSVVIKVGGSLFDMPDLAARLRRLLARIDAAQIVLFPGGGAAADVVRDLDRAQGLGEDASHWLAVRSLTLNAFFLHALLPEIPVAFWPVVPERAILDPYAFVAADESHPDHLPHLWQVTSDSLAARAATLLGAEELLLLKSTHLDAGMTWQRAAEAGIVDEYFPHVIDAEGGFKTRVVNFRG